MKVMKDFNCPTCGVFERYIEHDVLVTECDCGKLSNSLLAAPRSKLEGITGDFPDAHARWAKIREDNARIKAKREN